ncbi:TULIP family P47-like protein [Marinifilum sp. N1E240]|uniref:TULIP family P47-like protein n=1 Tax=Marinifilum sp. N1E240 TaxID=2608082 RepID=UPI00128DADD5|nr:TULIP family P47-like protein [Marinifilum sp. N1E240]MPQ49269.1 TULIP family P47-like protein [Marinifilum sp. N1E240]
MSTTLVNTGTTPVPEVVKELPVNKNADTNDWDTVFAIRFNDANIAITNNWSKVDDKAKNLSQAASDAPSYKIDGVLGPWQLTVGGDGKNIRMTCPFVSGTYNAGASKCYDVKGYEVIIEVGMEWVPNPDQFAFSVGGNDEVNTIKTDLNKSVLNQTLITEFKKNGKTISSAAKVTIINANEDWLITEGKNNYYVFYNVDKYKDEFLQIYEFEDTWKNNLQLLENAVSSEEPAVVIVTIKNDETEGIAAAVLPQLLSEWFNTNIGEFNHVFSSLDLSPALSTKTNYEWIKPTGTSYAVTDNGTLDNSVFGVLTMTQGNTSPSSHQVSPNAIPNKDDGTNAGFLISGTAFMKNMMLAGATTVFNNEPMTSFDITNDGLTVTNNKKLTWGRFKKDDSVKATVSSKYASQLDNNQLPDGMVDDLKGRWINLGQGCGYWDPGIMVEGFSAYKTAKGLSWYLSSSDGKTEYLLELDANDTSKINLYDSMIFTIKERQFKMSLDNSYLEIQFIDLLYPESWEYDVHINFTEQVAIGLKEINGKQLFWFDKVTKDMTVNVTKTKAAITAEIVESSIVAVLCLVAVVAPLIDGLRAAAAVGEVTEEAGSAAVSIEAFSEVDEETSLIDREANEADALVNGTEQVTGKWPAFKNAFTATRWKVLGGIAAAIGAGVATQEAIETIMEAMAKSEWEKVPGFDEFANDVIVPYSWPGVDSYDLKNAQLASSLQIGLETQKSS